MFGILAILKDSRDFEGFTIIAGYRVTILEDSHDSGAWLRKGGKSTILAQFSILDFGGHCFGYLLDIY